MPDHPRAGGPRYCRRCLSGERRCSGGGTVPIWLTPYATEGATRVNLLSTMHLATYIRIPSTYWLLGRSGGLKNSRKTGEGLMESVFGGNDFKKISTEFSYLFLFISLHSLLSASCFGLSGLGFSPYRTSSQSRTRSTGYPQTSIMSQRASIPRPWHQLGIRITFHAWVPVHLPLLSPVAS